MKRLKKALSLFLAGVIMVTALFVGAVSASAKYADSDIYVDGMYNTQDKYYIRVGNFGAGHYLGAMQKLIEAGLCKASEMYFSLSVKFDSELSISALGSLKDDGSSSFICWLNVGEKSQIDKEDILNARYYYNDANDDGVVFFFKKECSFVKALTNYRWVNVRSYGYYKGESMELQNYRGVDVKPSFKETDKTFTKEISSLNISNIADQTYTGKKIKPDVTVKDDSKTLTKGTDYTVSYKNNTAIGTATVTITGKGNYTGTKTVNFKIIPPKTTLKATRSGEKIKLTWGTVKNIDKYQIYYSTDGGKTYKKAGNIAGTKSSCSLGLPSGKTYTLKIRSYKKVDGKTYYSKWSTAVTVK